MCTPPAAPEDPLGALRAGERFFAIDDRTGLTAWDGLTPDYDACVYVLCGAERDPELDRPAIDWLRERERAAARKG